MLRPLKADLEAERRARLVREMGRIDREVLEKVAAEERRGGLIDVIAPLEPLGPGHRHTYRDLGTL